MYTKSSAFQFFFKIGTNFSDNPIHFNTFPCLITNFEKKKFCVKSERQFIFN